MSGRGFTGRHFALVMVAGFGIIIAVNLVMAVLAINSHPGMVVESSHVAGQKFNQWLEAGRLQQAQGWTVTARMRGQMLDVVALNALGQPLDDAVVAALVRHPLSSGETASLQLSDAGAGRHVAEVPVPPGLWEVEIRVRRGPDSHWMLTRLRVADDGTSSSTVAG